MTLSYVVMQNLRRNPLRTALTAGAFALPMAVFVAALSLVVTLTRIAADNEKELRLAVHHRVSLSNLLPAGMRRKIESLDPDGRRVVAVCGMRWFGGRVPNSANTLTSLAADVDTFPIAYSDVGLTPDEIETWKRDRTAAIVGPGLAERYGWKLGDRVVLESTVPPYLQLEFRVVKIIPNTDRGNLFYFRIDYLEESLRTRGVDDASRNIFWVKCTSATAMHELQGEIETLFANSPEPTRVMDENALIATFTQGAGNIPALMQAMAVVVVFIIALVAGNTMIMSVRERTRELAVFKAIGFPSWRIVTIVLGESMLLAAIGAAVGIVPTCVLLIAFPIRTLPVGPVSALVISPVAVVASLLIALLVGAAAGAWPAYRALRLRTVDALRRAA